MEVSHFELVWKPQSPSTPIGQSGVDRVFQGYFLNISNLEDKPCSFALPFVAAPATVAERSLAGNTVIFIDTPGGNNALGSLSALVDDEDRGTMLAALLSSMDDETANLAGMNKLLEKAGIELALEKRKSKARLSPVPAA